MPQVSEDAVWGMDEMAAWQEVWIGAVALAWRNPEFKNQLLRNPRKAIAEHFAYNLPPFLELSILDGSKSPEYGWRVHGEDGWVLPMTHLEMVLPGPPPDVKDQAVALADYSAAGRTYPFTTF